MSQFCIFTTGGELVEGLLPSNVPLRTIIEELGTIPPWQTCYLDPHIGVIIHIFTGKRVIPHQSTRKANNYYAAYVNSNESPIELISGLSTRLEERIRQDETSWVEVESKDSLKSELSDPELIFSLSAELQSPQTLSERGFVTVVNTYSDVFCLRFEDINKLIKCSQLAVSQSIPTVYTTERKAIDVPNLSVSLECGETYIPKKEARFLEDKVREIANHRQNQHIERLNQQFEAVNTAISNGGVTLGLVLCFYRSLRASVRIGNTIDMNQIENEELYSLATTIKKIRANVSEEASDDIFDSLPNFSVNKEGYKIKIEEKVAEDIQCEIKTLITRLIIDASSDIKTQIQSKAAEVAENTDHTSDHVQNQMYTHLSYIEPTEPSLLSSVINSISSDSKPSHNPDIMEATSDIESYIDTELIPHLTDQTGLTADEIHAKLNNTLSDQIDP
jgi:hypothetical protein